MDRRKNSRRPLHNGSVKWPAQITDPMEQRNAERVKLEKVGKQVVARLSVVTDQLNYARLPSKVTRLRLQAEQRALKDNAVSILAQLVNL